MGLFFLKCVSMEDTCSRNQRSFLVSGKKEVTLNKHRIRLRYLPEPFLSTTRQGKRGLRKAIPGKNGCSEVNCGNECGLNQMTVQDD